jgi:hypothetical protein
LTDASLVSAQEALGGGRLHDVGRARSSPLSFRRGRRLNKHSNERGAECNADTRASLRPAREAEP